jgi:hypothetical protein
MEEPEVPLESVHEHINEHAHHAKQTWVLGVALSAALLATIAAVSALLAGHHANEAVVEQIQATDDWSYYQSKGVKSGILASKLELLRALGKEIDAADEKKLQQYASEQEEIKKEADEKQHAAAAHLHIHTVFARAVTMAQIAIAVSAIAVLTRRRNFWYLGLALGAASLWFLLQGFFGFG